MRGVVAVVALTLIAVALIFFVPVSSGPFAATHGPVSALRARRIALRLRLALAAVITVARIVFAHCYVSLGALPGSASAVPSSNSPTLNCVLLC
jgi:hypothetical protein